ncbi:MAG: hypothetical protein GY788_15640 [bacterium]|nr:hypothetical protein [bacterium]
MNHRSTVVLSGALAGGLIAVVLLALFIGRFAVETIGLSESGDARLVITSGALYLATVVVALLGGAVVSVIAYGASSDGDGSVTRFELAHVMPFGLVAAVAAGYGMLRAGLGLAADAEAGMVTTTIATLAFSALTAGLVAGGLTAWIVATLAAKSIVRLEGEAAPANTGAMMKAAMQAVSGPMVAIVVIAALAIALAQLLLAAEGVAAIAIFGGAAALVLLGAAAAAYLGGSKGDNGAAS